MKYHVQGTRNACAWYEMKTQDVEKTFQGMKQTSKV
jgi:hypothetical protein